MQCPYCGNEMEKGYLQSRDGIGWGKKELLVKAFSELFSEKPLGTAVETYNCRRCKKLVIEYD